MSEDRSKKSENSAEGKWGWEEDAVVMQITWPA
jgi:hypothetical protein